jgi:predicted PurR-regulated permease PerM
MPRWVPWLIVAIIAGTLLTLLTLRFIAAISHVIVLIVFAEFVALALEPAVNWLERRGWRRGLATGAIMFAIVLAVVGFTWAVLPGLVEEVSDFVAGLPDLISSTASRLGLDVSTSDIREKLASERAQLAAAASVLASSLLEITGWVASLIGKIFSTGLIAFYFTVDAPRIRRTVCSWLPQERQRRALQLWEISINKVGGYLYSRAFMGFISGVATYIVLRILEVPFAAPLAVFVGFVSQFVPVIGTYIAYAVPVLVALGNQGFGDAIWLVAFALVYQQFENIIVSPRISARTMNLHPGVAFVAALVGGAIGGITGAFLALPIAAIVQAFGSTFLRHYEVVTSDLTREVDLAEVKAERAKVKQEHRAKRRTAFKRRGRSPGDE